MKYCPAFPQRFASISEARRFCEAFFTYYNTQHRHSGIGLHTPATVRDGTAGPIRTRRAEVLTAAYTANPARFRHPPTPPKLPKAAWINEPAKENIATEFVA
ncbi:integrase core domain-containing protein [Nocardia sp. NBC_01730]|nr:integrase core domain-containing protein [Nocardia sp. NBC_01730]